MNLPDLPQKHNKKEADFGLKFRKWIESKIHVLPFADYELKDSLGKDSIPFSVVSEEQLDSAMRSSSLKGNLIRIVSGTPGAPDYSFRRCCPTFFVIHFPKVFHVISLDTFLLEKQRSKRKSLTCERACSISTISVKL